MRLLRQLDVFGGSKDLAPATERMRLFEPAPAQLQGQTYLDDDAMRTEWAPEQVSATEPS
jgi:hypothetical protein